MVFSGIPFLYYFLPILLILFFGAKNTRYRQILLVVFSLFFYAWGVQQYVLLMLGMVALNYWFGFLCQPDENGSIGVKQKLFLVLSVILNIGILVFFKYTGFFVDNINSIFNVSFPKPSLEIPIGISFYTFQALSYVVDIYRGVTSVQKSFLKLLLYISLFPQLVAGPIVRYQDLEPQLDNMTISAERVNDGALKFAVGLAKKVLIANNCGNASENLLALSSSHTLLAKWIGAVFFTLQIYYDFSGYSDMAIGLGKILGFDFKENFDYPYASANITEFWRKWHISLGTWFKDYLFYPVLRSSLIKKINSKLIRSGRRKFAQKFTTSIALLIVWTMTGLWHGAAWNFVLWGIYYWILLEAEMLFLQNIFSAMPKVISKIISKIYFIIATVIGMSIFNFDTGLFKNLGYMFGVGIDQFTDLFTNSFICNNAFLLAASVLFSFPVIPVLYAKIKSKLKINYNFERILKTVVTISFLMLSTVRMVGNTYNPFLYFRF